MGLFFNMWSRNRKLCEFWVVTVISYTTELFSTKKSIDSQELQKEPNLLVLQNLKASTYTKMVAKTHKGCEIICKPIVVFTPWIFALKWYRPKMSLEKMYFALWIRRKLLKKEFLKSYIVLLRAELSCTIYASQMGQSAGAS